MTFEQTITDMSQLSAISYLPYGTSINIGDVYQNNVTLSDANGNINTYNFISKYTVIDYISTNNSMEGILLRNDTTGGFVIAFRGTQESIDGFYDITTGLLNFNPQIGEAEAFVRKMMLDYNIKASDLTLTGHSLGGILTQSVGATLNIQGVTFNAWSSSNLIDYSNYFLDPLGLIHRVASLLGWGSNATAFAERNILNLTYTDSGMFNGDPLSNALSGVLGLNEHLGAVFPIFGTDLSVIDGHRMPNMIEALNHYNDLLSHFEDKDFLVLTMAYMLSDLSGHNQFYEKGESYFNAIGLNDAAANSLSFNFLNDMTAFEIADQAKSDRAVLFAILKLNGFAVEGNLTAYSNMDLAHYSEIYIAQRSLFLYALLDPNNARLTDTYFSDRDIGISLRNGGDDNLNQIIFGSESISLTYHEQLIGGKKVDFLFGMNGDDILIGEGGNDYLEGGQGSDTLIGGKNYDTYVVDNGDIVYDSDGRGEIIFNNYVLEGGELIAGTDNQYEGINGEYYVLEGKKLTVYDNFGNSVVINSFNKENNDLNIVLEGEKKNIEIYVGDATATEGGALEFTVGLNVPGLDEDLVLDVEVVYSGSADSSDLSGTTTGQLTIKKGQPSGTFTINTNDDDIPEDIENFSFAVTGVHADEYAGSDLGEYFIVNAGEGTITDNDGGNVHITISSDVVTEGNLEGSSVLTFKVTASRELVDNESVTLNLNIEDITTDGSDYGFLSDDTITLNASNQFQTITLELFGDTEKEGIETLSINATVSDSTDLQDIQIVSGTGTITDDDQGATPYDDILILTNKNDTMDALAGNDYVEGRGGNDILTGNAGDDILWGGEGSDMLYGDSGSDILFGDSGDDYLEGGTEDDTLYGGDDNDVLLGGDGSDYLNGGSGFDYYITGSGDIVEDSDGSGAVFFNNADLSGTKKLQKGSETVYEDDANTYEETGGGLKVTSSSGETITIENYSNGALGITLAESENIEVSVGDSKEFERAEIMHVSVELQRELLDDELLVVELGYYTNTYRTEPYGNPVYVPETITQDSYNGVWYITPEHTYQPTRQVVTGQVFHTVGSVTFESGEKEKVFTYTWSDNDHIGVSKYPNPVTLIPRTKENSSTYSDSIEVIAKKSGSATIIDDDERGRIDPLVLDINKDGFISTTSLDDSNTYFDITGDGLRERVGWVSPEDALLTFDKNDNGQIDGISELFGNINESGFEELKRLVDSNHDNIIDRRDELFSRLQVWRDKNSDAVVQEGELTTLKDEGVSSIDLNLVETNIELNGNLLTEASKYTDVNGAKELVADIQLAADVKDTKVNIEDIPNFSIDESTRDLANIKGSGLVYDSFILYNIDPQFKALAELYTNDLEKATTGFDTYIEHLSGYTNYLDELKEKYSLPTDFTMQTGDKKAWIAERFLAEDNFTSEIEAYYNTNLNNNKIPAKPIVNDADINERYTNISQKIESTFMILSHYKDEFADTHYDIDTDRFIIDDEVAFNSTIIEYFNNPNKTIEEKVQLASIMQMQREGLNFNINEVVASIENDITQTFVSDTFSQRNLVLGIAEDDTLSTDDSKSKILLNTGDDIIQSGKGINTFYFRRGDGRDVIGDAGGLDKLVFDEGINRDDVIVTLERNADLIISLNNSDDKVMIVDWMSASKRVEIIEFGDGETLKFKDVLEQFEASDNAEILQLSSSNDFIDAKGGNDVIRALSGNDTLIGGLGDDRLEGGVGNDTYVFSRGHGKDTIIDTAGHDTLQFTPEITHDDLVVKLSGNDLLIALKEEGKLFEELSDVVTLKDYKDTNKSIESIFLDGYQRVDIEKLLTVILDGDNNLELGKSDDVVDLSDGDDTAFTAEGNDTIIGGKGDDTLNGGLSDDTYIFNRGDGKDIIHDDYSFGNKNSRQENAGVDSLIFGDGIFAEDIITKYDGANLLIGIKEDGKTFEELSDIITIKDYTNANNAIENILLHDGTPVVIASITNGTNGNDTLNFKDSTEDLVLQGLGGVDFIHGGSGDDNLEGNSGLDTVYAGVGNDTIVGGTADDFLAGGAGDDTYIFNRGDGADVILDDNRPEYEDFSTKLIKLDSLFARMDAGDTEKVNAGNDTLRFGEGILREDITYQISGNDLILSIAGSSNDSIIIKNHLDSKNMIENILLADGTVIDLFAATQNDDNLVFGDDNIIIDALAGNDIIATGSGYDTITGGLGNDRLEGGSGDDTYIFSRGDGVDVITDDLGSDTLEFTQNITQEDVLIKLIGRDLVVALKEDGKIFEELSDKVTIVNHTNNNHKLEKIKFNDSSIIDLATFDLGTNENDVFLFGDTDTIVNTYDADDNVILGSGNDTVSGGTGNDMLQGGNGHDNYLFSRGDGQDTIKDSLGYDNLIFSSGITQEDLVVKLIGRDLVVSLKEDGKTFEELQDKITIQNHTNTSNKLEKISFSDGSFLEVGSIDFGTNENDNFVFGNTNITVDAKDGDDIISTSAGNNNVAGGLGNDILKSGAGEDTLYGGGGNDILEGGRENDTYVFNRGDGEDTIHDFYNGYDVSGGIIEFDKDVTTDKMIVKLTGSGLIDSLKNREKSFASFTESSENIDANDLFIKLVGDDLVIALIESGKTFEDFSDKITLKKYISDEGLLEFGNGVIEGDFNIDLVTEMTTSANSNAGNDTLQFGEGIEQEDILYKFSGNDLILALKDGTKSFDELGDKILIKNYVNSNNQIENILFHSGAAFDFDGVPVATDGDDNLVFTNKDITVDALGGNDTITTDSGNDTIFGSSGNDTIASGSGADVLVGGSNNDTLYGGIGNDRYVFNHGDSNDIVFDAKGNDTIEFGVGIMQSDLLFQQDEYNLIIKIQNSNEIVVVDFFKEDNVIESIKFADGSSMSATTVATMLLENVADTLFSNQGAEMRGGKGDDTYVYKKDDFTVIIDDKFANKEIAVNAGNDTLRFEDITQDQVTIGTKGYDLIIKIDAGHDTYTELKDYVVIRDWQDANKGIESIVFGDGEVLAIDKTLTYPELEFDENWITGRYYIYGSENNDIKGTEHSEVIESGAGDDTVMAIGGNDYIVGGKGDDILNGGSGNDTYVFNMGDGNDTIIDDSGLDSIKFGANITRADITITQVNNDLVMRLSADDSLTLKDWFNEETIEHRIELMVLEDEGEIAIADFIITPTEQNDNLEYGDEKNRINALGGDDIIHIGGGNDVLFGGYGNDQLYCEEGNDTLSGDKGDDVLYGGEGDDTYVYARGDGKDTIVEDGFSNWGQTGNDTLKFAEGISADDLILRQVGDDLLVALKEDGKAFEELSNTITLKKWALYDDENSRDYSRAYYAVENFTFSDGTSWSTSDIIANIGSDESETIIGFNQADTLEGKKGDDTLLGHLGDDTYIFNRGDGHDTIYDYGRKGDDYSYYDAGNDTLKFGEGISEDELMIVKEDNDVIVYIKDGNKSLDELHDKIILKDWFLTNNRIENMVLFDGSAIDYIKHLTLEPTMEDDKLIYGSDDNYVDALSGDDIVISLGGNNFIDGNSGNDSIQTAEGNDTLLGGEGDDTLDGGAGEDRLEGGSGNDTYIFGRGDGHNTIYDESGVDNLKFDASITQDDLVLFQDGRDLIVAIKEDGVDIANATDKIILVNWLDAETRLETITFTDDIVWDVATIVSKTGTEKDDTISGTELDDYLEGGEGDDTYVFERGGGHDTIYDVNGLDSIVFKEGIGVNDLFIKEEGGIYHIALDEDGKDFDTFSDVLTISKDEIEKIVFADGSSLNIADIRLHHSVEDEILEKDELTSIYEGTLSEDTSLAPHGFSIVAGSVVVDSMKVTDLNILLIDEATGTYKVDGNFNALSEGEEAVVTFKYEAHYDSDDLSLVSGVKEMSLTITGTNSTSIVVPKDLQVNTYIEGDQYGQVITALSDGGYVIAWYSYGQDGSCYGSYMQQYNSSGEKVGEEKQVNTYIEGDQSSPVITALSNGGYVIAWNSNEQDGSGYGIYMQQYNNNGEEVGEEKQVNTYVTSSQYNPAITALSDGGYVIAWYSYEQDGSGSGIYMQQYNGNGEKIGEEKQVNSYTQGSQEAQVITALIDGGYVVAWQSIMQDGSWFGVFLQQYNGNGEKVGEEKQVNSYTFAHQKNPVITALSDGGYVIAWTSDIQDGSGSGIYMQQYNSNGEKVGEEKQVNTYIHNNQHSQVITALSDGGYVIAWNSYGQDGSGYGSYMQQYNSSGEKVGEEKQVSTYTEGDQYGLVITALRDGGYVIAWDSYGQNGSGSGIYLQQYNGNGENVGEEKQVNTYIEGGQYGLVITALRDGGYVIAWDSYGQDGSGFGIYMQKYNSNGEEQYTGYSDDDQIIYGGEGDDYIVGSTGDDILYGVKGMIFDYSDYYPGDDTFIGNEGDDMLYGGWGNDTYVFNRGDGHDTIFDEGSYSYYGHDKIVFGEGIFKDDLIVHLDDASNLIVGLKEEGVNFEDLENKITIKNYTSSQNRIEAFVFSDGSSIIGEEIFEYIGNIIYGTSGDDILYGGEGNDVFYADDGNDTLYGGLGNDTYVFNRGDGQDTIIDEGSYSFYGDAGEGGHDKIVFGEGISINDIEVIKTDGDDLQITIKNHQTEVVYAQDSILIKRWYTEYAIETMQFADGSQYNIAEYFNVPLSIYANPIVLDLNHNGVTSTALETSNSYFDYDGDGNRERTAWMEAGDAQLVVDINYDGIINDGSEIFGEYTKLPDGTLAQNGYEALAQYDSNSDGVIDNRDEAFGNLLLWKDSNQNGKSEDGELTNIQTSGIIALHLNQENGITFEQSTENGNIILNETNYISGNGAGIMRDVGFAYNPFDTITDNDTLTKEYYGNLLSGGDGNDTYIFNLGDGKIIIDDNGNGEDTLSFGNAITKEQLLVKWDKTSGALIIGVKEISADTSSLADLYDQIHIKNFFQESGSIELFKFAGGSSIDKSELYDILLDTKDAQNLTAIALMKDGQLIGGSFNDLLYGQDGEEDIQGDAGDDFLNGQSGDDLLDGGEGDDTLVGGKGDDSLYGGAGDDYYIYSKGDGRDLITDFGGNDTIALGDGIVYEDLIIEQKEDGLLIIFEYDKEKAIEERDAIFISDYGYGIFDIENIELANGESYKIKHFLNQAPSLVEECVDIMLQDIREATGDVGATDEDGDILTYSVTTDALHGTVNVDETGTWIYSVEGTYIGTDSAIITVDDGQGGSVTKTLNFDAKVSAPSIDTVAFNLLEDNISTNNLNVYNPVGGALTYEIIATSENGMFTLDENGEYSYNPSQNYNGLDAVIVKVTNEYGLSTTSSLTFDIEAVNDAPVTTETEAFILQDVREQAGEVEATDVDGDVLTFSVTTAAQHGTLSIDETGAWTYSVDGYYMGEDSAVITVDDGNGGTATKTLTFDARVTTPSLADATADLLEDNPSNGIFNVTNPIGGILTYEVLTATVNGDFSVDADGNWNYNPSQDYNGSDAVIVKVTNEYGLSTTSTLSFEIEAVNDAPIVALESEAFTLINIRDIDGKIEASDVDGDTLTYTVDTQAANGIVTVDSEGNWHYKADGSFNGTDSATILINDGAGGTVTSRLDFTVEGYIYEGGDLVITDNGDDTLVMDNLDKSDLAFTRNGDNLNIAVKDQGSVALTDYFINIQSGVQKITTAQGDISLDKDVIKSADVFIWRGSADGDSNVKNLLIGSSYNNSLDGNNLDDILFGGSNYDSLKGFGGNDTLIGGDNSDNLYGGDGDDNLWGDAGNDSLYGENGNDSLVGGIGHDYLYGGDGKDNLWGDSGDDFLEAGMGDDFLSGETGSDRLEGSGGNDTYFFEKGDQSATINDYKGIGRFHSEDAGYDTIKFGDGIGKHDVSFVMSSGNLYIQYGDTDTIKVNNQDDVYNKVEKLEFADGSFLTNDDIDIVIQQLNAYASDKGMWTYGNETIRNNVEMMNIVSSAWRG